MSEEMFNRASWERAMSPTIRTIGYFAGFMLILFVVIYLPLKFFTVTFGLPAIVLALFLTIAPFGMIFFFVLSLFKVLDENLRRR